MQYEQDVLRKLQLAELNILRDIDSVCRAEGIPYFLECGTLLGAVRHGGFIPWDDDVDVGMLRPDYERFLKVAPKALGQGYAVCEPRTNPRCAGMFAKVWKRGTKFFTAETMEAGIDQGIFVDVFPYDVLHSDEGVATRQIRRCRAWQSASYLLHARHVTVPHSGILGALERGACSVAHVGAKAFLSHERLVRSFEAWALRGSERPGSDYMSMAYVTDSAFPADELSPGREMLFEGFSFPVPARAESYLERVYGSSWRELPPIEARRNHAPIELDFGSD